MSRDRSWFRAGLVLELTCHAHSYKSCLFDYTAYGTESLFNLVEVNSGRETIGFFATTSGSSRETMKKFDQNST